MSPITHTDGQTLFQSRDYDALINESEKFNKTQKYILKALIGGGMIRNDIEDQIDIPRTTIYENGIMLFKEAFLVLKKIMTGKRGRPPKKWILNEERFIELAKELGKDTDCECPHCKSKIPLPKIA